MLTELPFVKINDAGHIEKMWSIEETGHYGTDCATGRDYFQRLSEFMETHPGHLHLQRVMQAMIEVGHYGPVEIGFTSALAMHVQEGLRTTP